MSRRSWRVVEAQDPRWQLPADLATRDRFGARDIGWVEQMRPFVAEFAPAEGVVLDPFAGFGTTLLAAALEGRHGLGFELEPSRAALARERLRRHALASSTSLHDGVIPVATPDQRSSVDLLLTSVPYFGAAAAFEAHPEQLYRSRSYGRHLDRLGEVFHRARGWLRPGGWCIAMAETLHVGGSVLPLAWDLSNVLASLFQRHDERVLLYPPRATRDGGVGSTDRSHEYALVFRHAAAPLPFDAALGWLRRWVAERRRFAVHGSFARHWRDPTTPPPHDLDLLFDPAADDLAAVVAQLADAGFRFSSWGQQLNMPIDCTALQGRYAVRAEQVDRSGALLRIDLGFESADAAVDELLTHVDWQRGLPLLRERPTTR